MDTLWSPWRYRYVTRQDRTPGCVFCRIAALPELGEPSGQDQQAQPDQENLVLFRGRHNFVVLNRFPYCTGHLMVVPHAHLANLSDLPPDCLLELMQLAQRSESALRTVYRPGGLNIGLNLGECAGAGIAAHLHLHVLPRWPGDASFMTTIGETRVIPEELPDTWHKLRPHFQSSGAPRSE
ncbi:MAG: HIT domain-containing protein [Bryobacterales bacterium]|nr:HIT domain-containing protein [Bryobacterales bacterium]